MQQNINGQNGGPRPRIEPQYVRVCYATTNLFSYIFQLVGDSVGVVNLTPNALQILSDHVCFYLHLYKSLGYPSATENYL